jgi:hypothetical protein
MMSTLRFTGRTTMTPSTKCDRNTPFESSAERKRKAHDEYDARMMNYMKPNRSLRHNTGKPDYSLIPMAALAEVAKVLEYGASKYERGNWLKPTSWEVSFACLQRHMSAWQAGEDNDDESGRSHIAHAACNLIQMLHMLENHPEELKR